MFNLRHKMCEFSSKWASLNNNGPPDKIGSVHDFFLLCTLCVWVDPIVCVSTCVFRDGGHTWMVSHLSCLPPITIIFTVSHLTQVNSIHDFYYPRLDPVSLQDHTWLISHMCVLAEEEEIFRLMWIRVTRSLLYYMLTYGIYIKERKIILTYILLTTLLHLYLENAQ